MQGGQLPRDPGAAPGESGPGAQAPPLKPRVGGEPLSVASRRILGLRVDATSYAESLDAISGLAAAGAGGMVCHANVHMVMEAFDDAGLRRRLNAAERVTPDGVPLVWALRRLGLREVGRVYGPTLMSLACRRAEADGIPVGFYGGHPEVLDALVAKLSRRFPRLRIAFAFSPPFRPLTAEEDRGVTEAIEASGARILFVGLGCPKQERWMAAHRPALGCVLLGVGAAFSFLAGAKPQAPRWMQRGGLEWLFRLGVEPRRLWRRYLIQNPRFVWHFARQVLAARSSASSHACR
jgi:N-acetylglucosaminyldiphosphoundecaprenol N-acetyl-beta-D-mannosaminyltransferase